MRRRFLTVAGLALLMLTACGKAPAPDAISAEGKAAYQSLMKLKSAIEVGTTYSQYNAQLIEAHAATQSFLSQPASARNAVLAAPLKSALESFVIAGNVLRLKAESGDSIVLDGNSYYDQLIWAYPAAADFATPFEGSSMKMKQIKFAPVLDQIIAEADAALDLATQVMKD